MDRFATALVSKYTLKIPPEHDWFAPLVGDWDIRYIDSKDGMRREVKGEWLFRRVLNGTGIEDLLLCPFLNPECIMTIRMYHAEGKCYDATYTCEKAMYRLRFVKEGARLIGTNLDVPGEMQIFSDIRADYFKWNGSPFWRTGRSGWTARFMPPANGSNQGKRHPEPGCLTRLFLCEAVFDLLQACIQRYHDLAIGTGCDL